MNTDGWKVFATYREAQIYANQCWAGFLYQAPVERIPVEDQTRKPTRPATELTEAEVDAVADIPLAGIDYRGIVVRHGSSSAWAVPRQTKAGFWAVPCPEGFDVGGPEPRWPDVPPFILPEE